MNTLPRKLHDRFSCSNWIVIHSDLADELIRTFGFVKEPQRMNRSSVLETAHTLENRYRIVVYNPINDWQIVEGEFFELQIPTKKDYLGLAAKSVYTFSIDLWMPLMKFAKFDNHELIREYEYYFDSQDERDIENESGQMLSCEQSFRNEVPKDTPEYGYFWLPLRIMEDIGITQDALLKSFDEPQSIYRLPEDARDFMDRYYQT